MSEVKTNQKILQKAIEKAVAGGWDMFGLAGQGQVPWYIVRGGEMPTPKVVEEWPQDSLLICGLGSDHYFVWEHVIFNHDFAKALWAGTTLVNNYQFFEKAEIKRWVYHLQQMVIADDPITYLGENTPK